MSEIDYTPGKIVLAKLHGFPWWPAKVVSEADTPEAVMIAKKKSKRVTCTVCFFGTNDYGFFDDKHIQPISKPATVNQRSLKQAYEEAQAYNEKNGGPAFPITPVDEKKRGKAKAQITQAPAKPKRQRSTAAAPVDSNKKRRKSLSSDKEEDEPKNWSTDEEDNLRQTPLYKRMLSLRYTLQSYVYNKQQGEIPSSIYPKIAAILEEIEHTHISYFVIRDTKIGKVVKAACRYKFDDSELTRACNRIMKQWADQLLHESKKSHMKKKGVDAAVQTDICAVNDMLPRPADDYVQLRLVKSELDKPMPTPPLVLEPSSSPYMQPPITFPAKVSAT
ncbi:hypothetical protein BCR43DRAFT_453678 [Syncephalastrum racemosum]|uniref:PWWP domain-containing protein n=1 Tax=Syncephalastrum racemosum TaxID=13706 RepID=A0A1X2HPK3_SYNRA|nr:hypothetical protein BCR43DRAFT_453678 [Syncephalastrum racemosum]